MDEDFILYVDFDRTLYDSHRLTTDLFGIVARCANTSTDAVFAASKRFISHPGLGGYDYEAHISSFGLEPKMMWQHLDELVAKNDYLYPDSIGFIQALRADGFNPIVLSFGESRFQMVKIDPTLRALAGEGAAKLQAIVVDRKKHEHIRKLHAGQTGVLVDDVPEQELPEGFTEIHLDRERQLERPLKKADGYTVCNLKQAREVIHLIAESLLYRTHIVSPPPLA